MVTFLKHIVDGEVYNRVRITCSVNVESNNAEYILLQSYVVHIRANMCLLSAHALDNYMCSCVRVCKCIRHTYSMQCANHINAKDTCHVYI